MAQLKLEKLIGDRLREKGWTLSIAESCTGGLVSDRVTNVSGSSDYFEGGVVSYSIQAKARHLGIPLAYVRRHGAVSPEVAKRMAEGVRRVFRTTFGLSTTGVAGPAGGTKRTPVGTVFIGLSDGKETLAIKGSFKGCRRDIKEQAAERCLQYLYERIVPPAQAGTSDWVEKLRRSKESTIILIRRAPHGISGGKGRLGIFPASFNPPTLAHAALIREARKRAKLDEVLVLLDIRAMDKEPIDAKPEDRLAMMEKTFRRDPRISIGLSNRGLFLKKIEPLRRDYPPPVQFFFIVGFDTILRVMDKKYYLNRKRSLDELFAGCHFLVANRGDLEQRAFEIISRKRENKRYLDKISYFTLPPRFSSFSSSLVRERIARGQPVDQWVPAALLSFLGEKGLYKTRSGNQ